MVPPDTTYQLLNHSKSVRALLYYTIVDYFDDDDEDGANAGAKEDVKGDGNGANVVGPEANADATPAEIESASGVQAIKAENSEVETSTRPAPDAPETSTSSGRDPAVMVTQEAGGVDDAGPTGDSGEAQASPEVADEA